MAVTARFDRRHKAGVRPIAVEHSVGKADEVRRGDDVARVVRGRAEPGDEDLLDAFANVFLSDPPGATGDRNVGDTVIR